MTRTKTGMLAPCNTCRKTTRISDRYKGKNILCEICLTYKNNREAHLKRRRKESMLRRKLSFDKKIRSMRHSTLRRCNAVGSEELKNRLRATEVLKNYDTILVPYDQYVKDCKNDFLNGKIPMIIGPPALSLSDVEMLNELSVRNYVKDVVEKFK